jgi:hypothetical protein
MSLIALYISSLVLKDAATINLRPHLPIICEDGFGSAFENCSYLVSSPKCQIPNLDPFDKSIRKFVTPGKPIVCSTKPLLTYVTTVPAGEQKYLLKINATAMADYGVEPERFNCCYSVINRINVPAGKKHNGNADNLYSVSGCSNFTTEVGLNSEEEFVLVRCLQATGSGTQKEVYKNTHAVVPIKPDVELKLNKTSSERRSMEEKRLSVLVLGFDSVSRLNLLRTMPKTVNYLRRKGWLEMFGYNKVGDNTLPNLAALLTGLRLDQLSKQCWMSRDTSFDNCPFIWREYSNLGYVTAYAEDEPTLSTFNYHKAGFVNPPTDYYIRPFLLASKEKLPVKKRYGLQVCLGPTPTSEHIFQYTLDFATVFKNTPYFMMSWMNNFSHNNNAIPAPMDDRVVTFFHQLKETGAFNTTFIIFLSDHGMRWGKIRNSAIGWYEERLPFIYVWVPEWFRQKHPDTYNALKTNRDRLTSPFDMHLTLREIVRLSRNDSTSGIVDESPACPKCVSLSSEVSDDRACEDAGITADWCTCNEYRSVSIKGKEPEAIALHALSEINAKLKKAGKVAMSCAELTLKQVIELKQQVLRDAHEYFVVIFETLPGGARFEATVLRSKRTYQLKGDISRINTYGNQSGCVDDSVLKLYCYCI